MIDFVRPISVGPGTSIVTLTMRVALLGIDIQPFPIMPH